MAFYQVIPPHHPHKDLMDGPHPYDPVKAAADLELIASMEADIQAHHTHAFGPGTPKMGGHAAHVSGAATSAASIHHDSASHQAVPGPHA